MNKVNRNCLRHWQMAKGGKKTNCCDGQQHAASKLHSQSAVRHVPLASPHYQRGHQHGLHNKSHKCNFDRIKCLPKKFGKDIKRRNQKHSRTKLEDPGCRFGTRSGRAGSVERYHAQTVPAIWTEVNRIRRAKCQVVQNHV